MRSFIIKMLGSLYKLIIFNFRFNGTVVKVFTINELAIRYIADERPRKVTNRQLTQDLENIELNPLEKGLC